MPAAETAQFRIGSVKYLNAVPLTRGIEDEVFFATPAQLAEMLRRDELDAALVSITEVLLTTATTSSTASPSRRWARFTACCWRIACRWRTSRRFFATRPR